MVQDKKLLDMDDLIFFGNILKKYSQPIPKSKLKKSNDFIKCAKRDLRASNLLFNNRMYPEYAYHLQQAVEKLAKAYVISLNSLTDKQFSKISHKTPKSFINVLEEEFQIFEVLKKIGANLETNFADLNKIINSSVETEKLALAKKSDIKELLDQYEKLIASVDFDSLELNKNSTKKINNASDTILNYTSLDKKSKIFFRRILRKIFKNKNMQKNVMNKKFRDSSEDFVKNLVGLYFLSIITYPHEAFTRYPDKNITPFFYKKSSTICYYKNRFFKILKNSIKVIEKDNKNKKVIS